MKYYFGIDVGGTSVKGGIIDESGNVLVKCTSKIENGKVMPSIKYVTDNVLKSEFSKYISSVGVGVPCLFDKALGTVSYGNNLSFNGVNLSKFFYDNYNLGFNIANDADAAVLGELRFGAARGYQDVVLITIGTGIGCGIILNGKLYENGCSATGEFGHTVIKHNGRKCSCGRRGCFEVYASTNAFIKDCQAVMRKNKDCILWENYLPNEIDGKIIFDNVDKDVYLKAAFNKYLEILGVGITNIANLLRPQVILIGGGVSAQGDKLIKPLNDYLINNLFAKEFTAQINVVAAKNGNDAGILGAAALTIE